MTDQFAFTWAFCWLAGFGIFSLVGILTRMPLPDMPWPLLIGAFCGAWITGPILIYTFCADDRPS